MIRQSLAQSPGWGDPDFRWRGGDVSRLEGLTDAAFGVAMALLIVSTEMPQSYQELMRLAKELPAFAVCFIFLLLPWYAHFKFFRRFGLQDLWTVTLNAALLFVVLFYVYPLRFLFTSLFGMWFGLMPAEELHARMDGPTHPIMLMYGSGLVALFGLLALLNWHGYRKRVQLELNEIEIYLTRAEIRYHLIYVLVAAASVIMTLAGVHMMWAGFVYMLYAPLHFWAGFSSGRGLERLKERVSS